MIRFDFEPRDYETYEGCHNYWFLCKPIYMMLLMTLYKQEMIEYLSDCSEYLSKPKIQHLTEYSRLDLLKVVYSETNSFLGINCVLDEAKSFEIIKYLTEMGASCSTVAMDNAVRRRDFEIVKWLHLNRTEGCSTEAMDSAASCGNMDMVEWLHLNRSEGCTTSAMNWAPRTGHFEVVKFLHYYRTEGCTAEAMDRAAGSGYLEIVKFLHYNRTEGCTTDAMDEAAKNGNLEIVKWLHLNRTEGCSNRAMDYAALYGHIEIVKFLHVNRSEGCTTNAMDGAAEKGYYEVVKWLHLNRSEGCKYALVGAARYGDMKITRYLVENGLGMSKIGQAVDEAKVAQYNQKSPEILEKKRQVINYLETVRPYFFSLSFSFFSFLMNSLACFILLVTVSAQGSSWSVVADSKSKLTN